MVHEAIGLHESQARHISRGSQVVSSLHQEAVLAAGQAERLSQYTRSSVCVVTATMCPADDVWLPWRPWGDDTCRMGIEACCSVCVCARARERRFGAPLQGGQSRDVLRLIFHGGGGPSPELLYDNRNAMKEIGAR